jgi:gliding motility-associated protein GldM
MASGKISPRQKMINMMYLVLTAMLALNVSSEILKAFYKFEVSMQNAGKNLDEANIKGLGAMDKEVEKQGEKARPFRDKAYEAKKIADEFVKYIEEIKTTLLAGDSKDGNNPREEDGQLKSAKDMEIAVRYFLENKQASDREEKGKELMNKINETREKLLGLIDDKADRDQIKSDLRTEDPPPNNEGVKLTWLQETFHSLPLAAAFANLTKYQNDAKKTETDVINYLATKINATDFKFDNLVTTITAPTASVSSGSEYTAEIFLTAYNSKVQNEVYVDGNKIEVKDGKGQYKIRASGEGSHKYKAIIKVIDPTTGQPKDYPADGEYQVFSPNATISASKMSIFYAGIDNPLDVSVPGYRPNQVSVGVDNGTIAGAANGGYNVKVQMGQNRVVHVNVTATGDDKVSKSFTKEFKIRPLPPLAVTINGKEGGGITGSEIQVWNFVNASFGPSFAYDGLQYTVNSYQCIVTSKTGSQVFNVNGPQVSMDLKAAAARCRKGDLIIFYNIKASSTTAPAKNIDSGPVFRVQ